MKHDITENLFLTNKKILKYAPQINIDKSIVYHQKKIIGKTELTNIKTFDNNHIKEHDANYKRLVGNCGVYVWVLSNIKVSSHAVHPGCKLNDFSLVKIGMTNQDNGFIKRITSEMKDASILHDDPYDLGNIVCIFNGKHWTGHESNIRKSLGIPIGNSSICKSKNSKTIQSLLHTYQGETIESIMFKNGKLKVRAWSLWMMHLTKTTLGPTELILMHNSDIMKLRDLYKKNIEIDIDKFEAVKNCFENDECVNINFTNNVHGPLIFN
jgi:hypothetical protein